MDYSPEIGRLTFSKEIDGALIGDPNANILDIDSFDETHSFNAEAAAPEAQVAPARAKDKKH